MNERVGKLIDGYREAFVETLSSWIRVPSVKGEAEGNAPFGAEVRRMLDLAMKTAREMGFTPQDYDGYACDMTLGDGAEEIAVLGHLDVVPAGDGWTRPPFEATLEEDRLYGRGVGDDKGPVLASLFAMRAIREAGIPLKKTIRLILGCDEESGWEDMAYYASKRPLPEIGFSPDASFPLINTEKGMLHFAFRAPAAASGLKVLEMTTGERPNVIPGESTALLAGGEELAEKVRAYARDTGLPYAAAVTAEGVRVTATGIPGHSAYPEGRRNAIGMMLKLLVHLGAEGPLAVLARTVGMEHDGRSLGCACEDAVSGPLTCNMGILHLENGVWLGTLDLRCPISADLDALEEEVKNHLEGLEVETTEKKPPHHVPPESALVTSLLKAYEEETGWKGEAMSTGGGTYAKVLKQGVAFGAQFPDEEDLAHQANEFASVDRLMLAMKIYANALIRLAGA